MRKYSPSCRRGDPNGAFAPHQAVLIMLSTCEIACRLRQAISFSGFFAEFRDGKGAGASAERERHQTRWPRAKRGAAETTDTALKPLTGSACRDSSARQSRLEL